MSRLLFFMVSICLFSCLQGTDSHLDGRADAIKVDTLKETLVAPQDTCFCSTEKLDSYGVKLTWGHGHFLRTKELNGLLYYRKLFCNGKRQVLSFACGSPCEALVVLPMDILADSVQILPNPIGHSESYNFVVGASSELENELIVYDLDNKMNRKIMVKQNNCEATFYMDCLELVFEGDSCFTVKTTEGGSFRWKLDDIFGR